MRESYRTLAGSLEHEPPKIKGSRFIARVAPCGSAAEGEALVAEARIAYPDARHHCWAWRLGPEGAEFRSGDDGEPSGSAGRPILQQIEAHELTDVAVVVVRYFGGVKLGVGGLIRAYGGAAAEALARAPVRTVVVTRTVTVAYPYELSGAVQGAVAAAGLAPADSDYEAQVVQRFAVPLRQVEAFVRELRDRTAGQARITVEGEPG